MKFHKVAPELDNERVSQQAAHEGPVVQIAKIMSWVCLLASGATVALAWHFFLNPDGTSFGGIVTTIILSVAFVFPVEYTFNQLARYFWREVKLRGKGLNSQDAATYRTVVILLIAIGVYSFGMSFGATKNSISNAAPKQAQLNTAQIEQDRAKALRQNSLDYAGKAGAIEEAYAPKEKAIRTKARATGDSLQAEIAHYEGLQERTGKKYTSTLQRLTRALNAVNQEEARQLSALAESKTTELSKARQSQTQADSLANSVYATNLSILRQNTDSGNANRLNLSGTLGWIASLIAAFSIVFEFFLLRIVETFYVNVGIKRRVIWENPEFTGNWIGRFLAFPLVAIHRHIAVRTAKMYEALPSLPAPNKPEDIYDPSDRRQKVVDSTGAERFGGARAIDLGFDSPPLDPSPGPGSDDVEPFSLKESETVAVKMRIPDELNAAILDAFNNPPDDPEHFEALRIHPRDFSTVSEYMEKVKKNARNCLKGSRKNKTEEGRQENAARFSHYAAELTRMYVRFVTEGATLKFTGWLSENERERWRQMMEG